MRSHSGLNFSIMLIHAVLFLVFIFTLYVLCVCLPVRCLSSYLNILSFIIHPVTLLSNRISDFLYILLHFVMLSFASLCNCHGVNMRRESFQIDRDARALCMNGKCSELVEYIICVDGVNRQDDRTSERINGGHIAMTFYACRQPTNWSNVIDIIFHFLHLKV